MKERWTVTALSNFGRVRLSQHFYMRDFLFPTSRLCMAF